MSTTETLAFSDKRASLVDYGYFHIIVSGLSFVLLTPLIIFIIFMLYAMLTGEHEGSLLVVLLISSVVVMLYIACFKLFLKSWKGIALARRIKTYLDQIINQGKRSIDNIASELGRRDIRVMMDEIQQVMDLGFLPGYKIDRSAQTIDDLRLEEKRQAEQDTKGVKATFTCRCCGANNVQYRAASESVMQCEYCGTGASV